VNALDLYCGAGGAARGLQLAGFHVLGVDIRLQPRYCGDEFVTGDALAFLASADLARFDFIWASPPCQRWTALRHAPGRHRNADLIGLTRTALQRISKPYAIENVVGAPLLDPIELCGTMFGLRAPDGAELRRHRLFETSWPLILRPQCQHGGGAVIGVYRGHCRDRRRPPGSGHRAGSNRPKAHGLAAMDTPWMTLAEASEAIPPAFSRWIAEQFLRLEETSP
jgi:DNA (cytosine-5)-methyltransferase 1